MAELDLLDNSIKKQIAKDIQSISLVNNMILLTIVLFAISVVFLGTEKYLNYQTTKIREIKTQNTEEARIGKINDKMEEVYSIQTDYVKWSQVLVDFSALVPEGNRLESVSLDKENQRLSVRGISKRRDDFLKLKKNLEKSNLVTELESPISNLLNQTNINFTLEAKLNL